MHITLIDNGTKYLPQLLELLADFRVSVVPFGRAHAALTETNLIVLSGGSQISLVDSPTSFAEEIELVRKSTVPIIGICLGFELLALAFGATFKRLSTQEKGLLEVSVELDDPIFQDKSTFAVFENHRLAVDSLPPTLIPLARSKDGVEVVRHKRLPQYAFQFHPEMFTDRAFGKQVFLAAVHTLLRHV